MTKHTLYAALVASSVLFVGACGGGQPATETPDDAVGDGAAETGEGETGDTEPAADTGDGSETDKAGDGIVRDADGDSKPDTASDCKSKNEKQCKISQACAWSDEGKCVEASE